jgi:hypothetical protein
MKTGDEFNLFLSNSFDTRVLSRQNGADYSGFDLRGRGCYERVTLLKSLKGF